MIYTIAFAVNFIMLLEWQRPLVAAAEAHHYYDALFMIIVAMPTIVSVPAAILTRIIVGEPIRKGLNFYTGASLCIHVMILGGMKPWGERFLLFILELIFCVAATCEILGYKKGEPFYFLKSVAKLLREKGKRRAEK